MIYVKVIIIFGFLSLISLIFSHLAITDILHGESDLSAELMILRVSFIVILIFITYATVTFIKFLKRNKLSPVSRK